MALNVYSLDEKIEVMEELIKDVRASARYGGNAADQHHYDVIKAITADLRARNDFPKNNTRGMMERQLNVLRSTKTPLGYAHGQMIALANIVIGRWPTIQQALEQFGEESCE